MTSITIESISKTYGVGPAAVRALRDIDLQIAEGEFFFLLGPSGCGKTTLLRIIAGMLDPTGGRIRFGDRDVTKLAVEKRNTAMVFQNYALWPHMTIAQNVEFGPKMKGKGGAERRTIAEQQLQRVQLPGFGARKPNQLSGGQQQRVALARALAADADCLLLDEPLSNLDARLRMQMRGELRQLVKATGATGIYVTHDQKEALSMADRIAVMHDGVIVQVGTPEDVYNRPATRFVADFIGEANFLPATLGGGALDTPAGRLPAPPDAPADGDRVLCVRPEWLRLEAHPGEVSLAGTVVGSMYLGEVRQYTLALSDGTPWRLSTLGERRARFEPGQDIHVHLDPETICLLPR